MALIRKVVQHPKKKCWAYVEYSDENENHQVILGDNEFETREEALLYSDGFEPFSYEWVAPEIIKLKKLQTEKEQLEKRLSEIDNELKSL